MTESEKRELQISCLTMSDFIDNKEAIVVALGDDEKAKYFEEHLKQPLEEAVKTGELPPVFYHWYSDKGKDPACPGFERKLGLEGKTDTRIIVVRKKTVELDLTKQVDEDLIRLTTACLG